MTDKVLDLRPRLRARQQESCSHPRVVVSLTLAQLECEECHGSIDPWWWLRKMATEEMNLRASTEAACALKVEECNAAIDRANGIITRLRVEIADLTAIKNRLANESRGARRSRSRPPRR